METGEFTKSYLFTIQRLLDGIDPQDISRLIKAFDEARLSGNRIFFIGNGGSAVTAKHFANDLSAISTGEKRFKAISLVDNIASVTAIANDQGYEYIFVKQLERLFEKNDVVVGISASGNSKNIVNALEYANKMGGVSVALVGFDGGIAKKIAKKYIHINTKKGDYGPVEDIHLILEHLICSYLINKYESGDVNA